MRDGRKGIMHTINTPKNCENEIIPNEYRSKFEELEFLQKLGLRDCRNTYTFLISKLIGSEEDKEIATNAIWSLATLKDPRATLPLINYFYQTGSRKIKESILDYMESVKDPRSLDFLAEFRFFRSNYSKRAKEIIDLIEKSQDDFTYRYCGLESLLENIPEDRFLLNRNNFESNLHLIDSRPQTYIVDLNGDLYLGGQIHEHVHVAQGEDVLAAGEITIENYEVVEINNRSNGYHPHPRSFVHVKKYFENSDIKFDKDCFDQEFPKFGFNDEDYLNNFRFGLHTQFF